MSGTTGCALPGAARTPPDARPHPPPPPTHTHTHPPPADLPVAQNGVGTAVLKSTDAGLTWSNDETAEPFALLLLDIAASAGAGKGGADNVAVVGALSMQYSVDGAVTFNESFAPLGAGQCIRALPGGAGFAAVGTWGLADAKNGPAVSTDKGAAFTAYDTKLTSDARYGAFPSSTTWYITAGDWPNEGVDDNAQCDDPPCAGRVMEGRVVHADDYLPAAPAGARLVKRQGARMHLLQPPGGAAPVWARVAPGRMHAANTGVAAPPPGWSAQIAKTTDAGKTWATVFNADNAFYFNGIECTTEDECCAVGEDQGNNVTSADGTYVYCTTDGGATWVDNFRDTDPDASLIDIAAFGPSEYWAVGGELGAVSAQYPTFYHTTDAGKTWVKGTFNAKNCARCCPQLRPLLPQNPNPTARPQP